MAPSILQNQTTAQLGLHTENAGPSCSRSRLPAVPHVTPLSISTSSAPKAARSKPLLFGQGPCCFSVQGDSPVTVGLRLQEHHSTQVSAALPHVVLGGSTEPHGTKWVHDCRRCPRPDFRPTQRRLSYTYQHPHDR